MRVLVVLAFIGVAYAGPRQNARIVGGTQTTIEKYPFMTSMQYRWGQGFYHACGATLITSFSVISTASCYDDLLQFNWRARVGSTALLTGGTSIPISSIIQHPNYTRPLTKNNIAILKLSSPVVITETTNIARIAGPNYVIPDGSRVYTAGWGIEEIFGGLSLFLRHVDVRVVNHALCTERYADLQSQPGFERTPTVWPENLCTGLLGIGGQDACAGDMGGPVVHHGDILIGLTDWAFACGNPYYPRVNVRVSSYIEWIVQVTT